MSDDRPTPEQMLARLEQEGGDSPRTRGRLKVFFGYAAGVGKTYAMLQAARKLQAEGVDVVAGYVEPHGRPETEALLAGLESLPVLRVPYRGATLAEFDLDAALARKPQVILVDELAHTNAPGVRHAKRWQDVEELLQAGIDVHTTLNVQHVDSLNDVVAQVSGVTVRETVPDEVFERADDVALIDLTPDELLGRLREGKVYVPQQAARALEKFFRRPNLVALRELALRRAADRVHADVEQARRAVPAAPPWPTNERLLVCVGPSPTSARVIRATKRLADSLRAPWVAVHVETPAAAGMDPRARGRLLAHLRLAERLGGEVTTLAGEDVVRETVEYARSRNVTKIVIGKSDRAGGGRRRGESLVSRLLRGSGDVDVYVIRGADEPASVVTSPPRGAPDWRPWAAAAAVLAAATAAAWAFHALGFAEANVVMVYLLGVVAVGARFGRWPAAAAAVLAVVLFDVFFTRPFYTVAVHDSEYVFTFAVMLLVGLMASTLTARVRRLAELSRRNERRTEALYRLGRELTAAAGRGRLMAAAERAVSGVFRCHAVVFVPDAAGRIRPVLDHLASFAASATEVAAAQWVFDRGRPAGLGTDTLPNLTALYLPLATPAGPAGVLSAEPAEAGALDAPEARRLLETYCAQIALALERDRLAEESREARVRAEAEQLRSSLLSAVSHDLRTPLAVIAGASSGLLEGEGRLDAATRRELLESIFEESDRLSRLVENLLQMTRISSGAVAPRKEWHPADEVIGSAIHRLRRSVVGRAVRVEFPEEVPMGHFDAVLVEQVLLNLLDNAVKYSPEGSPVDVRARRRGHSLVIEVADRGRGLTAEERAHLFERFYRGSAGAGDRRGAGLGLAICKAVADAHGGTVEAEDRPGGGAVFRLTLPAPGPPPAVPVEDGAGRGEP